MRDLMKNASRRGAAAGTARNAGVAGAVELLTPERVSEMLGISKAMVYKMVRNGDMEAVRIGRLVRFTPESIGRMVDRFTVNA